MHITVFQSIVLGIVQGLTEFLPISSTGHLAIVQRLFGVKLDDIVAFDVMLHIGTLVSIIVVFYEDVIKLINAFIGAIGDLLRGRGARSLFSTPYRRLLWMLALATLPAVVASVLFKEVIDSMFESILVVGVALLITAALLYVAERLYRGGVNELNIRYRHALFVGIMQMFAITPGLSRSGSTIVGGLLSGFEKQFAIKFAFLMGIPAILGAAVLSFKGLLQTGVSGGDAVIYAVGAAFAMVFGIIAIKLLNALVRNGKLAYFSIYCAIVGIFAIVLNFVK